MSLTDSFNLFDADRTSWSEKSNWEKNCISARTGGASIFISSWSVFVMFANCRSLFGLRLRKLVFKAYVIQKKNLNLILWSASLNTNFLSSSVKYVGLQNLIQRNEQLYGSGNAPNGGVALPFILVQVRFLTFWEIEYC